MKNFKNLYEAIILTTIPTSDSVGEVNKTEEPEKLCEPCDNFSKNVADFLGGDITQPDDNIGETGEIDNNEVQGSGDVTEMEDGSISIKLSDDGNELVLNAEVLAKIKNYLGVEDASENDNDNEYDEKSEPSENDVEDSNDDELEDSDDDNEEEDEVKNESKKVNPWAVCTASTGNKSGKKRERCIKKVKKENK